MHHRQGRDLSATVRCIDGIVDVQMVANEWICSSCGRGTCRHSAAVEDALDDRLANGGEPRACARQA